MAFDFLASRINAGVIDDPVWYLRACGFEIIEVTPVTPFPLF